MNELINSFEILLKSLEKSRVGIYSIDTLINEISNTIQLLKSYEFIYIPFLGLCNSGKSTLINGIIGKDILPFNLYECTKRGIIIKYNNSDDIIIRKAYLKEIKSFQKTFYYFEPDNIIGKGIDQVKETLISLNYEFTDNIEDFFYIIYTKIKLFDDLGLDDYQKNMIHLIDFPRFYYNFEKDINNKVIEKVISISNFFIFVVKEFDIKDHVLRIYINKIFTQVSKQKQKSTSQIAKSILFVINNFSSINITDKDIDEAKLNIQSVINYYYLDIDSINVCFLNARDYSEYCYHLNLFFNLKNLFAKKFKNFSFINNSIYINPELSRYERNKTFCLYFYKFLRDEANLLGFEFRLSNQKSDENVSKEIDEIFNEFSKLNNFGNDSKYKDRFIKLISFIR